MSEDLIRRVPSGIPTGGQFASHDRNDGAVELMTDEELCAIAHLIVGDEFPYCVRCEEEFPGMSTLEGHDPAVDAFLALDNDARVAAAAETIAMHEAERIGDEMRSRMDEYLSWCPKDKPVGYTFKAENYRNDKIVEAMISAGLLAPAARDMNVHEEIEMAASANAIDMDDLYSYDTDDFPKAIFDDQIDYEADLDWLGAE